MDGLFTPTFDRDRIDTIIPALLRQIANITGPEQALGRPQTLEVGTAKQRFANLADIFIPNFLHELKICVLQVEDLLKKTEAREKEMEEIRDQLENIDKYLKSVYDQQPTINHRLNKTIYQFVLAENSFAAAFWKQLTAENQRKTLCTHMFFVSAMLEKDNEAAVSNRPTSSANMQTVFLDGITLETQKLITFTADFEFHFNQAQLAAEYINRVISDFVCHRVHLLNE